MWKEKSPGLKILWLWTFGTAAVLVTSVVRTRVTDMDQRINAQQDQTPHPVTGDIPDEKPSSDSAHVILED